MKPELLQLLAAREGGGGQRQLLEQLLQRRGIDPSQLPWMAESVGTAQSEPDAELVGGAPASAHDATPEAPSPERRLRRIVRRLRADNEVLQETNDALAAALGACATCWGNDPDCERCDGEGAPGSAPPDRDLFMRLVAPAVRHLRDERRERAERRLRTERRARARQHGRDVPDDSRRSGVASASSNEHQDKETDDA